MEKIFSENLKKFRLEKGFTQEQVAEKLSVNTQTVSRWECGTTLPDVLILPVLARLYEVTVDDFYKKSTVAYGNFARRLASVYEKSRDPEDFMRCRVEYLKLIKEDRMSTEDKWLFGWIHMYMMNYCRDVAVEWYDKAVSDDPDDDPHNYEIACGHRIWMYFLLKRDDEIIAELTEKAKSNPGNPREADHLIIALIFADRYEEAYACFRDAIRKFPDDWRMYIHGGDIAKKLEKYDEAMGYYDKAGEIGTYFCDELYCKASLFEDMGEYEKSADMYMKIHGILKDRGYDVEAEMAKESAREVNKKIND